MKLWQIKAEALRLMFADSDMQFNEEEFSERIVYENFNTADKLVRMEDSIRRAIDLYYVYVGEITQRETFNLLQIEEIYTNTIDLSIVENVGFPTRVDARFYSITDSKKSLVKVINNISFIYDGDANEVILNNDLYTDFSSFGENAEFIIWYKVKKANIPYEIIDEMVYDLGILNIPEEVQRMIPYYIKSELYEEDEAQLAMNAKQHYIQFLMSIRKPFSNNQTRVIKSNVFKK